MAELEQRRERVGLLRSRLKEKILVLDGGTGTALQEEKLTAKDFGGEEFDGCNENLVLTRPDVIQRVHRKYLQAGADIVETDTFGATPLVLAEYQLGHKAYEINKRACELAREVCRAFSTPDWPRFVAGSIGPTTKAISLTGGITFDELSEHYYQQVKGLYDGGADYFLIETCNDTTNIKACLFAIDRLHAEVDVPLPIAVSGTIEPMGTMLAGQGVDALLASLQHRDLLYVGLNCATGPEFMTDHIRTLATMSPFPISCVPNAGLPDENGAYLETPEMLGNVISRFIERGWLNVLGGCCGTHAGHVHRLREIADRSRPRSLQPHPASRLSGIEFLEITDEMRPVLVGERTNVIGSKKFRDLITSGKWEEAAEVGRAQVKKGAQIVDVCLSNPDRDELTDVKEFLPQLLKKVKSPIMIDSTDAHVIEESLKMMQGKAIINSVNLEDGEDRFAHVLPLAKKYGAAVVVGCIDDDPTQGMGISRERKLEIAQREYVLLQKYGIPPEDIYWDALVFPCGTGDAQYKGSAVETIEGVRLLKETFPGTRTVLGISNVSFGLPTVGREALNSVFLYHCVKAGLDLAIVNSEKIPRFGSLSAEEIKICEDLLWNRGDDPVATFATFYRSAKPRQKEVRKELPLDERLAQYIIEGTKEGLFADLDLKLKEARPLEIINGPLMNGMDTVGRLFNKNEMIVAEVLQSAEAMKAAVSHLEPYMEKAESALRGTVVLATVKGDVHDIGKNLVEIILSNNGFKVINLGIKIPSEQLIRAVKEHKPDILGLSGLLVKSAQQMEVSAGDLKQAGIQVPILVGGAALSQNFTDKRIAKSYGEQGTVLYAKDAMGGLDLAKQLVNKDTRDAFISEVKLRQKKLQSEATIAVAPKEDAAAERSAQVSLLTSLPRPPDLKKHIVRGQSLDAIWKYVNHLVLFYRHLGMPGEVVKLWQSGDKLALQDHPHGAKMLELAMQVDELKQEVRQNSLMQPEAVFQFFPVSSQGNLLHLYKESGDIAATFDFPRQRKPDGLCISDYAHSDKSMGDTVALFCVTAGKGIREKSQEWKQKGEYLKAHALAALALETAEAYAELLHGQLRAQWGFPDAPEMTMMERFQAKYRGCRYSFGYPACPRLDDQAILWQLLQPEEIGVQLTEGFMMDPEASVSAMAFHHPQAKYFAVGE